MAQTLPYVLAASLKEMFPSTDIDSIVSTPECFFCDFVFPGQFEAKMLSLLEERMRQWISQQIPLKKITMMAANAVEMLQHLGDKKLARKISQEAGEVVLFQLDRFFFQLKDDLQIFQECAPYFKLVCFRPLHHGMRLIGTYASSKAELKKKSQIVKNVPDLQKKLEERGYVGWIKDTPIWERDGVELINRVKEVIKELYRDLDEVMLFEQDEKKLKDILIEWNRIKQKGGFYFKNHQIEKEFLEFWDPKIAQADHSWGKEINSYLHLITKFLTILSFDYEIVSRGRLPVAIKVALKEHKLLISHQGKGSRLEFRVADRWGRRWTLSTLEWDEKNQLVQMTLCISCERCSALLVDGDRETLLNRLKQIEN